MLSRHNVAVYSGWHSRIISGQGIGDSGSMARSGQRRRRQRPCQCWEESVIIIISMALGVASGLSRSAITIAVVGMLIAVMFLLAAPFSTVPLTVCPLLLSVAGYNAGLINLLLLELAIKRMTAA